MAQTSSVWTSLRSNLRKILSLDSEKVYLKIAGSQLLTTAEKEELATCETNYKNRMRKILNKFLPQKAEEQFKVFCKCLTEAGGTAIAAELKRASDSIPDHRSGSQNKFAGVGTENDITLKDVLEWSYLKLNRACATHLDPKKEFKTEQECRLALLDHLKEQRTDVTLPKPPIDMMITTKTKGLHRRRKEFTEIVDAVKNFVNQSDWKVCLEDLGIKKTDVWMTDDQFEKCERENSENPSLLVVGLTSAGKSTFLNCLLGCSLLPTSRNACTSMLCELKNSDKDAYTASVLYDGQTQPKSLNLESLESKKEFVNCATKNTNVKKLEVFLPCEFLKYCTLLDSQGVVEDFVSSSSSSVELIEKCQESGVLCSLIYILDATRSPEEAVKGASLIQRCWKLTDSRSCLVVLNKFDDLSSIAKYSRREEYKKKVLNLLKEVCPGFKPDQLICMNSRLAFEVSSLGMGTVTNDLKAVCSLLNDGLVSGFYNSLLRGLRNVQNLTKCIRVSATERIKILQSSKYDREKQLKEMSKRLETCETNLKNVEEIVNICFGQLVLDFSQDLRSSEVTFTDVQIDEELLLDMLPHTTSFKKFHQWMEYEIEKEVSKITENLSIITDPEGKREPIYRGIYARALKSLSEIKSSVWGRFIIWLKKLFVNTEDAGITQNKLIFNRVVRRVCVERIESFDLLYNKIPAEIELFKSVILDISSKSFDGDMLKMKNMIEQCGHVERRIWSFGMDLRI